MNLTNKTDAGANETIEEQNDEIEISTYKSRRVDRLPEIEMKRFLLDKGPSFETNNDWYYAMRELSYNAFKLWMWMASGDSQKYMTIRYLKRLFSLSDANYNIAITELKEKNYLQEVGDGKFFFTSTKDWRT